MKPANAEKRRSMRKLMTLMMSLLLLCGNLGLPGIASGTEYYAASDWVLLAPTVAPTETTDAPAALTATADNITFTITPEAGSAIAGANFTATRVTGDALLTGAQGAYTDAFGADSLAGDAQLRLYQFSFSVNGAAVDVPSGLTLTASSSAGSGFVPVRGIPFSWQSGVAGLGSDAGVEHNSGAWTSTVALSGTDKVLFATAPTVTEATATPAANSGVYTFDNGQISLTATVGGSLPPDGAQFFVEAVSNATVPVQGADGSALQSILGYHVGFRTSEGELGANEPLSIHVQVLSSADYSGATTLVSANGDVLWSTSDASGSNTTSTFDFSLPVGSTFLLAEPVASEPTAVPAAEQPSTFTYEDSNVRVQVTLADPTALPAGAVFTASLSSGEWATYADRLMEQGFDETSVQALWTLSTAFTLDGNAIDTGSLALTYDVVVKGAASDGAQAWVLHSGTAELPDGLSQAADGAEVLFSATGESTLGLALVTPLISTFASIMSLAAVSGGELPFSNIASNIAFTMKVNGVDVTGQSVTVDRDAQIQITMTYALSNTAPIDSTATYVYDLSSNGITVMDLTTLQDVSYGGATVGKFYVQNNKLYVTYNEGFVVESNKTGVFSISAKLNPDSTGTETSHTYTIGESTQTITVIFNQGSYSLAKDYLLPVNLNGTVGVRFTITNNQQITSATFEDTLSGTLLTGVVAGSLKIDGTATAFTYNSSTKKLTFSSGTLSTGTHYVEYTATVNKSIFGGVTDPGTQTKNTVVMNLVSNGTTTLTDWDQIGWVYDSNNLITKDGWTDTSNTGSTGLVTIYWRVTYNRYRNTVSATNPKIEETIPTGLTLTNVYERINDGASTEISNATTAGVYTYSLSGHVSDKVELIFKTTVPLTDAVGKTYPNNVKFKADDWPDVGASANTYVGTPGIDFAKWVNSTNANAKTAQWTLAVTANNGASVLTAPTTIEDWVDANNAYQSAYTSLDRIYYRDSGGTEHNLALNTDYTYTIGSSVPDQGSTNGSPNGKLTINLTSNVTLPLYVVYSTAHDSTGLAPGTATFYNNAKITTTVNGQSVVKYADANWTKQANYTANKDSRGSIQYDSAGHANILWVYSTMANNGTTFTAGQAVTIIDTMPVGVEYDPGTAYVGSDTYGYTRSNFNLSNMTQVEPVISNSGKTLTWTFTPTAANQTSVNVVFHTTFTRALLSTINNSTGTNISLTNVAETRINDQVIATDDRNWTRWFNSQSILSKGADSYPGNKSDLLFRIEVNQNALNLSDNSTLTLTDTLADYLTFDPGVENALTVYAYDGSTATALDASQYHYTYANSKITVTIPDEKRLLITFRAYLNGAIGDTVQVQNAVKLEGVENSSTHMDQSFIVQEASGSVRNTNLTIQVKKYDEVGTSLPDAEFTIYKLNSAGVRGDATVTFTTNAQGVRIVEGRTVNGDSTAGVLQYDQLYELVETRAPAGYEKSQAVVRFIFPWYINGVITADSQTLLDQINANGFTYRKFQGEITGTMTVTDQQILLVNVHVNKAWKNADGTDYAGATPDVTVQLRQNGQDYDSPVTLNSANSYAYDFTNLPKSDTDGNAFTYTVVEGAVPGFLPISISADNDSSDNYSYTLTNAPTGVTFSKQSLTGGAELPGAHLTLTDITPAMGQAIQTWSWISTDTAHVISGELIAGHTYTLTETTAPNGYAVAETITFTMGADGLISATDASGQPVSNGYGEVSSSTHTVTMKDAPIHVTFSKRATGAGTAELAGATLTISHAEGGSTVVDDTWISGDANNQDGSGNPIPHVVTTGLKTDGVTEYTFTEVGAPDGYALSGSLVFRLATDGTVEVKQADGSFVAASQNTLIMTDAPIHVAFSKRATGAGTAELAGATLTISHMNGGSPVLDDTWISGDANNQDSSGNPIPHVVTTGLKADGITEYTFTEVGAPDGYTIAGSLVFRIATDGTVQVKQADGSFVAASQNTLIMTDAPIHVTFSKRATGAGTAELAGATLTISHMNGGSPVVDDTWVSGDTNNQDGSGNPIPHVVTTGLKADGITEYTFTEVGAPDGYTIAGSLVFRIATDGTVQVKQADGSFAAAGNNAIIMTDAPIRFKVAKVDAISGAYLAGAEFKVVPDVSGAPGTTAVSGFESIVSGTAPILLSNLSAGTYWLVETKAPVGTGAGGVPVYYQKAAPVSFTLTNALLPDNELVTVTVRDTPTTVTVLKLDSAAMDNAGNPTGNRVNGAVLTLTRKSDGALLGTHTFDGATDWVLNTGLLEPGVTYILNETVAGTPEGYLCAYSQEFTVAADGADRWIVVDEPIPLKTIVVEKVWNDTGLAHNTVYIDLYRSDNSATPYLTATLVPPATSVTFDRLPTMGKDHSNYSYIIRERTVDGYLPGKFTGPAVSTDGNTFTYTLTNTPTQLIVNKFAANTGAQQAGAQLAIVKGNGAGYTAADIVQQWTSGTDGQNADGTYKPHTLLGVLNAGQQYTLVETLPPTGYVTAASITFTYLATGVTDVNGTDTLTLTDQPTLVKFGKLDNLTGKLVAGAQFKVYKDTEWQADSTAATPVYTFTSTDSLTEVKALFVAGEMYRLVETQAPSGYQINGSSLQFRAPQTSAAITVTMKNPRLYTFYKVDENTGKSVAGAILSVVDANGTTVIPSWTSSGSPYEFVNSDENGDPILKAGVTYRFIETKAPKGYEINTSGVAFQLDANGFVFGGTTISLDNRRGGGGTDDTVDLTIRKTWVDHSNAGDTRPSGGLKVNIYRKLTGETLYSTLVMTVTVPRRNTNTWTLTVYSLPRYDANGVEYNYLASEVLPKGYTVTYTNNGFTMVNTYPDNQTSPTPTPLPTLTPTPVPSNTRTPAGVKYVDGQWVYIDENGVPLGVVPQTGDESDYVLWGLAIALPLLVAGIAGVVLFRKKRREAKPKANL